MTTTRQAPDPDIRLVTILRTADAGLVAVVKSILDAADIDYFLRGETLHNVMGWSGPGLSNGALGEAEFQVRESDAADATRLLARLTTRITPVDDERLVD